MWTVVFRIRSLSYEMVAVTDETVKVCAYNFSESAFIQEKQAIIELTLRTI